MFRQLSFSCFYILFVHLFFFFLLYVLMHLCYFKLLFVFMSGYSILFYFILFLACVCILKSLFALQQQARMSQEHEQFLVNPFGMLYSEITASTLVKVDVRGEIIDSGSTGLGINKAGFTLHSAIHQARPDIRCVIHLHTPAAVAVSIWTNKGFGLK